MSVEILEYGKDEIVVIQMKNDFLTVQFTNLGCHILSILMPDCYGVKEDIVLGYECIEDYYGDINHMGGVIGRVANRISGGRFTLNGREYPLEVNNGPNCLHGGNDGFDSRIYDYEVEGNKVIFTYVSKDMEQGFPGNLTVKISYELKEKSILMKCYGVCDQDTLINLTNHSYFNLAGNRKEKIYNHKLQVKANQIAMIDEMGCTTGEFMDVDGTPFDFREFHTVGERIHEEHQQLKFGSGYDIPYILSDEKNQITLIHPESGREMIISTSLPVTQVYSSNFLGGEPRGKEGVCYGSGDAICLETQYLPDSVHIEDEPKAILRKGEEYVSSTEYKFSLVK
ncbi:MAG: galactose mutarotase [Anaerostipes sp.]|nr:galactose mutarotase [Anaerostipes sp.]